MAKGRTESTEATATASDRRTKQTSTHATVTHDDVAHRAYDLYVERGREDGHDVEDWLQAEGELQSTAAQGGIAESV
jgi:Protein of unknown function (DUF2934)